LRIIGFKSENIKKIKLVELAPNYYVNRISGANESGKTSLLDAIEWVLRGTSNVPSAPVRKGSGKAVIVVDLGDMVVTRRFVEGGSRNGVLTVESKDGKTRFQSPQDILDKLVGKISFDPLEFIRMHPSKQFEVLYSLVLPDVDPTTLNIQKHPDYIERRDIKKAITALETQRDAILVPQDLPRHKHDESAILLELTSASDYNAKVGSERREREATQRSLVIKRALRDGRNNEIESLRQQIAKMERENAVTAKEIETLEAEAAAWGPLPELKNATELGEKLKQARAINAAIDKRNEREAYQKGIDHKEKLVEELSASIKAFEDANTKAIEEAKFPVEGLAFGDEEVMFEGFPFNQASNAAQIRCSVAIGMAYNPQLRVMRIKDGSLLDDAAMKVIAEMAVKHDTQVWVEIVDTSGKVGVYLEDGEVKAINDEPEPQFDEPAVAKPAPKKATRAKKIPATA
jgi:AAA domain